MTAPRSRKEDRRYELYRRDLAKRGSPCEFCTTNEDDPKFVKRTKHFKVIKNLIPYSLWDGHDVAEHLLVVPSSHVLSLSELPPEAAADYFALIADYEKKGYNVYARAQQSKARSIPHQHTHLILSNGNYKRFMLFTRLPYVRVMF